MSFIPFSFGQSKSKSGSESQGTSGSFVDPGQQPFLDFLRNTAKQGFGQQQQAAQGLQGTADQLFEQGQGIGQQFTQNQFLDALGQQAGGNPDLVAAQTGQLGSDLGTFFREQLLPQINQGAFQTGQLGGGRQGVAEGVAAGKVADAFSRGSLGFQTADAAASQQAAQAGGQLFGQGAQAQGDLLSSLFGIQQGAFGAGFAPGQQLQQLIGGPTVLDQSQQSASAFGKKSSFNFGIG